MMYFGRRRWKRNTVVVVVVLIIIFLLFGNEQFLCAETRTLWKLGHCSSGRVVQQTGPPDKEHSTHVRRRRVAERRRQVNETCRSSVDPRSDMTNIFTDRHVVISPANHFLHCPVAKAASSFWYRFMTTLNMSGSMETPYNSPLIPNMGSETPRLRAALPKHGDRQAFVDTAFKIVFVREPYSRMLSAYVDKVFAPNPTYWGLWGKTGIKSFRSRADAKSLRCGHDLTFAELMKYANMRLHRSDIHFQPMVKLCKPCAFHYDFIGKMETFPEDVVTLAEKLNLSTVGYFASAKFREDYVRDAIQDSILSPFSWMEDIVQCMSKYEAGRRIWRKLQIRGFISRKLVFPYSQSSFEGVTARAFIDVAFDGFKKSTDKKELRRQKRDAFVEAYQSVSMAAFSKLTNDLTNDFVFFDYDSHPREVFDVQTDYDKGAFDWERDW